jgi:hypothetical protein
VFPKFSNPVIVVTVDAVDDVIVIMDGVVGEEAIITFFSHSFFYIYDKKKFTGNDGLLVSLTVVMALVMVVVNVTT